VDSPHNMSAQGPGAVRALTEGEVCIFCHTPHGATADAPLWNRYSFGENYQTYDSTTAKATTDQPTGASKLCLSCHDGTVALGLVRSRPSVIEFAGGVVKMPLGRSNLGTDLSDDHPISFVYDTHLAQENGELRDPGTLAGGPVRLDKNRRLQCTACHNAHDNQFGHFLVKSNLGSALCLTCHEKAYWNTGLHRTSEATWNGQLPDPWPWTAETTVAANGCESCHAPHGAQTPPRLLYRDGEEQNCYACHNGHVAVKNIATVFAKDSVHPVSSTLHVHDPLEDAINPPRHVECADCHNPHAANAAAASKASTCPGRPSNRSPRSMSCASAATPTA
jgi:predicted CXXCH cytochrome family protein